MHRTCAGYPGRAASAALVDQGATYRKKIWQHLMDGTPPQTIIELVNAEDPSWNWRQYGIVDMTDAAGFTGFNAGWYKNHLVSTQGTRLVARAAVRVDARLVYLSTVAVYGSAGFAGPGDQRAHKKARPL